MKDKNQRERCCCHNHNAAANEHEHCHNEAEHEHSCCCCHSESHNDHSCCHGHKDESHSCCSTHKSEGLLSEKSQLWISFLALAVSFICVAYGYEFPLAGFADPSWVAIYFCALPIVSEAFNMLKNGQISSPALVTVAMFASLVLQILCAFGYSGEGEHGHSYIFVAGEIAFLMALGEFLEERTVQKARSGINALSAMMPKIAKIKRGGNEMEIPSSEIAKGDILCVRSNEMFASDGVLLSKSASVNEANMTGESLPVSKKSGDSIMSGTFNVSEYAEVLVQKSAANSSLAKLVKLVEEAEGKKAPISRLANKWAAFIVPSAIILSVLVFLLSMFCFSISWQQALIRGITILVVFCPCAFVLATPTAIAAAIGNGAKHSILIKSGEAVERLAKTNTVFFDKTGTLTMGKISLSKIVPCSNLDESEIVSLAASAEELSDHPIAKAVVAYAKLKNIELKEATHSKNIAGVGTQATIGNKTVFVGKPDSRNENLAEKAATYSEVKTDGNTVGYLEFSDTIRPTAKAAIEQLEALGIDCAMLSGDNKAAADNIAKLAGIRKIFAELLPQDKLDIVSKTQASGKNVCMVGDGVNDAPALALANASVAVADLKNDIALSTAQASLLGGDLTKIANLIKFSKTTIFTAKANMVFSVCVNICAVVLAFFGIVTPVWGALIHNLSSVTVVLNSASLLKRKL